MRPSHRGSLYTHHAAPAVPGMVLVYADPLQDLDDVVLVVVVPDVRLIQHAIVVLENLSMQKGYKIHFSIT